MGFMEVPHGNIGLAWTPRDTVIQLYIQLQSRFLRILIEFLAMLDSLHEWFQPWFRWRLPTVPPQFNIKIKKTANEFTGLAMSRIFDSFSHSCQTRSYIFI